MPDLRFLDYVGLQLYHSELEKLFDKKLDIQHDPLLHGGKFMMVNDYSGLLEPRPVGPLGLVDDVEVDGISVVTGRLAEIDLSGKQDALSADELEVLAGEPFTEPEKLKLQNIAAGAQANVIESISVNGTPLVPDQNKEVEITAVRSLTAISGNVTIDASTPDLTIFVEALEMPDEFTSVDTPGPDISIGDPLTDMDATILEPIKIGAVLNVGDVVIFANNIQATVTSIEYELIEEEEVPVLYDAIVTRVPSEVTFAGIKGSPMNNAELAAALNGKMNLNMDNATLGTINAGKYLYVSSTGAVAFGEIAAITSQQIWDLFEEEIEP